MVAAGTTMDTLMELGCSESEAGLSTMSSYLLSTAVILTRLWRQPNTLDKAPRKSCQQGV